MYQHFRDQLFATDENCFILQGNLSSRFLFQQHNMSRHRRPFCNGTPLRKEENK
jgi:hypothetical protein